MAPRKTTKAAEPPEGIGQLEISVPKVSLKSSKQELLDAYQDVVTRQQDDSGTPRNKAEAEARRREDIVQSARTTTVTAIVESIGKLKLDVSNVLNGLSEKLIGQAERFKELEDAISTESARLSRLHDIEIAADTLAVLLQRHAEAETEFAQRIELKRKEVEEALGRSKAEFEEWVAATREQVEAETSSTREAWEREQALHEQEVRERNERLKKD
ncbi:MAG: hypothetical protein MUE60_00765, partial [Candidatus Eisenbacteria bacterium]|nr:hypothetical protein [Candidatus Eisenbacteria bacterium]